ncbi:hypothetical protein BP6252_10143 [Coleophoma cylindrospora]|uniref:Uncharacterized protein n=1 Tax=Coleophoma cylindrospora TaxID=1849047 RepID=A0A3D8QXU2_9HELO|nr:hypothetical protein BP6252_10143 [Coleophoma cylindrospora]
MARAGFGIDVDGTSAVGRCVNADGPAARYTARFQGRQCVLGMTVRIRYFSICIALGYGFYGNVPLEAPSALPRTLSTHTTASNLLDTRVEPLGPLPKQEPNLLSPLELDDLEAPRGKMPKQEFQQSDWK